MNMIVQSPDILGKIV